jgi:aminoglycoside N3'-acetyltransferase
MNTKKKIANFIKKMFKIRSVESVVKKYNIIIGKKFYKRRYNTKELIDIMKEMGLKEGSNVFIHSTWGEFYNYTGTIKEFIQSILNVIGKEGTLAMPAYPFLRNKNSVFNIKRTPTLAGLIAEEFRNYPGVKRSISMHSVCALGPMSDYLTNEHQFSKTYFDEKSPYFKLSKINALVFTFGLGKYFIGTIMHCAEGILCKDYPYFSQFFTKKTINKYQLEDNSFVEQECFISADDFNSSIGGYVDGSFTNYSLNRVVRKYFDISKYRRLKLSNLTINCYDANYFINRTIELGKKGIVIYAKPNPKEYFK